MISLSEEFGNGLLVGMFIMWIIMTVLAWVYFEPYIKERNE